MRENIKKHLNSENIRSQINIHNLGLLIIVLVALSVSWSSTKVIQRNYDLLKQISVLEQQVRVDEIAVSNQRLMNEYYKTDTYLEIAARRQFNKALPGEKMMLVPKSLAQDRINGVLNKQIEEKVNGTDDLKNWQKWARFLTGRSSGD